VELAGAMAEIAGTVLREDFRHIDTSAARILLLEAADRVLPTYPPVLSERARRQLEKLGVEVRTGSQVTGMEDGLVRLGDLTLPAENVFWAAGVAASPLGRTLGVETDRAGRVLVRPDCSVPGHPEVFVIGDLALATQEDGTPVPGVAQGAMQMGRHVAHMIRGDLRGESRRPFRYRDKGNLATIGRAAAVADIRGLRLWGLPAWLVWVFVHIAYLIGFRNRMLVMMQWAWAYLTYQRGIRLITGGPRVDLERARTGCPC
jgi:NADH dehydrogenase